MSETKSITANSGATPRMIWKLPKTLEHTGLSRATLYAMIKEGKFPKQRKISSKSVGWFSDEVQDFIDSRPVA